MWNTDELNRILWESQCNGSMVICLKNEVEGSWRPNK